VSEKPVLKVDLQRADVTERVSRDSSLFRSPLVDTLGSEWREVFKRGHAKRAAARVVLFQQGDEGDSLLFVLSGAVRLFARKASDTVELGVAHPGDVIGEAAGAEGRRAMSAVANELVEFVELPRAVLQEAGAAEALERWLSALHSERLKALDEMTDFLNRW